MKGAATTNLSCDLTMPRLGVHVASGHSCVYREYLGDQTDLHWPERRRRAAAYIGCALLIARTW